MDNKNYWPDVMAEEKTKCVFELFLALKTQLQEKYDGRIHCQFEPVVYKTPGLISALQNYHDITNAMIAPLEAESDIEIGKSPAQVMPTKEYKFVIYDEKRFFRILDVKFGSYFPIQVRQSKGIDPNRDYKYFDVDSESEFRDFVFGCLNSSYVKDVIRYMLETQDLR